MTIGEIIQRIQSLYSKGVQSDDSRLTPRHIYNKMLTVRSKLLSQQSKKRQHISQWNYQTIPCVELIKAQPNECPCIPPIGCAIYRTKEQLPKPLNNLDKHLFQSVTSIDGDIIFSETSWIEKKYKSSNKYTSNKPDFYIRSNHLYVTLTENVPRVISITGLFEDPLEVNSFPSFCNTALSEEEICQTPFEKEFPFDAQQLDTLIEMCIKELVLLFSQGLEDQTNNGMDSPIGKTK